MNILMCMLSEASGEKLSPEQSAGPVSSRHGDLFATLFPELPQLGTAGVEEGKRARLLTAAAPLPWLPVPPTLIEIGATDILKAIDATSPEEYLIAAQEPLALELPSEPTESDDFVEPEPDPGQASIEGMSGDAQFPKPEIPVVHLAPEGEGEETTNGPVASLALLDQPDSPVEVPGAARAPEVRPSVSAHVASVPIREPMGPRVDVRPAHPAPWNAPTEHAPAVGLTSRPDSARTDIDTPARGSDRIPVAVTVNAPPAIRPETLVGLPVEDATVSLRHAVRDHILPEPSPLSPSAPEAGSAVPAVATEIEKGRNRTNRLVAVEHPTTKRVAPDTLAASKVGNGDTKPPVPHGPLVVAVATQERPETLSSSRDAALPVTTAAHSHGSPGPSIEPHRSAGAMPEGGPRPILSQVAHAITRSRSDGVVEVRLQPEELGRIRLSIHPTELGHSVQVNAERPETLDLIRRHIDILAGDLRERGFGTLDFSFGQDARQMHRGPMPGSEDSRPDRGAERKSGVEAAIGFRPQVAHDGRLDMRI
jgi:hypothetical protein